METFKVRFLWKDLNPKYPELSLVNKGKKLPQFYNKYSESDFSNVYEPAEDSFLIADTLEEECKIEGLEMRNSVTCEVGCGSSFVSINFVLNLLELGIENHQHFCFDINKDCINLSNRMIKELNLSHRITCLNDHFFNKTILIEELKSNKDKLIFMFNPPYVTTEADELDLAKANKDIYASWAGGDEGNQIILEFANYINSFVKEAIESVPSIKIILYLLLSCENNIDKCLNSFNYIECVCLSTILAKNERLGVFKLKLI